MYRVRSKECADLSWENQTAAGLGNWAANQTKQTASDAKKIRVSPARSRFGATAPRKKKLINKNTKKQASSRQAIDQRTNLGRQMLDPAGPKARRRA